MDVSFPSKRARTPLAVVALVALALSACDVVTQAGQDARTGWYNGVPAITPQVVTSGHFGQVFSASVVGQVFAQPLIREATVFVATEANNAYALDAGTGAQLWSRNLGTPWNTADIGCNDITPTVGVTGTPVIDTSTNTEYLIAKQYVSGTSGPSAFWMHALDLRTGAERRGFPFEIRGRAANTGLTFNPTNLIQRPGLLINNGIVYAAFGSLCDASPYAGWVIGISPAGGITTLWSAAPSDCCFGASVWQSGSGLASDGPGQILFLTGNGFANVTARPGSQPGADLGEAVVRLAVQPNGSLQAVDFFSPSNADFLDSIDQDLGSGAPVVLPANPFSTPSHPNLVAAGGKEGYLYLLDAGSLGGMKQGPGGTDKVAARVGPYPRIFGKVGVWPGDGGYLYLWSSDFRVRAFHFGVDGNGAPTLTLAGTAPETAGYASTAGTVTSQGMDTGSAVLWVVDHESAAGASTLRAYNPVPAGGALQLLWSAPIGNAARWTVPAAYNGRMYLGTNDGKVLAFGATS